MCVLGAVWSKNWGNLMRSRKLAVACFVILCVCGSGPGLVCFGGEQAVDRVAVGALAGRVIDGDEKPVPQATVWLVGGPYDGDVIAVEKTTTDAQGRFTFPDAESRHIKAKTRRPEVLVRAVDGRLGWETRTWGWPTWTPRQDIKIRLVDIQGARGRVVDADDKPLAHAKLKIVRLSSSGPEDSSRQAISLFSQLADEFSTETAADGTFTLRRVPVRGGISSVVTAAGFGSPRIMWDLASPVTIRLERAGSISGSLEGAPGAALGGVQLYLYRQAEQTEDLGFRIFFSEEASTDDDGSFRFDNVPPGKYVIRPSMYESDLPFHCDGSATIEVKPGGAVVGVSLPLSPTVEVRGRVVETTTERGIAAVSVSASRISDVGRMFLLRQTTTDADGNYVLHVVPSEVTVMVAATPVDYVKPRRTGRQPKMNVTEPSTWPNIELERAVQLEGVVVDQAGKPVSEAKVQALVPRDHIEMVQEWTDVDGKFRIRGLRAKDTLALRAQTDLAVSDTLQLRPADASGLVRLEVSADKAFVIEGTCVDAEGHPVKDANIGLSSSWMLGSSGLGFGVSGGTTDAEGRFVIRSLWPGYRYEVNVKADGFKKLETEGVEGHSGRVHDVGKLILSSLGGVVEGQVVDSAGRPVPEVRVFNPGDAAKPVSVETGADGRFRLEDLPVGPVYVFAEKDGYRFTAIWTQSNGAAQTIRLTRNDEPIPAWAPLRPPVSFAREQEVARRLLQKLWAMPKHGRTYGTIQCMARIDPEVALEWSTELGGRYDWLVRQVMAAKIALTDAGEALSLLPARNDGRTFRAIMSLAESCLGPAPDEASRFAEEAVLRARNLDQPDRTSALANAGAIVSRLGNAEAGRKLAEEAAAMAAKLSTDGRGAYTRGIAAAALAPHDLLRAMALVEAIDDTSDRDRALARMAAALAPKDLERALEIVDRVAKRSTLPDLARLDMAYQLAATRPDDALRVVEEMDSYAASKMQTEAYGWMAVAIAPHDKLRARSLIDKCATAYWDGAQEYRSWSGSGGRSVRAALLVSQAGQTGYPEMDTLISRVLAMRPNAAEGYSPREIAETSVVMAKVIALVDPGRARQLLDTLQPRGDQLERQGIEPRDWLQAWALADLQHAEELFERALETAKDNGEFSPSRSGVTAMLEVLTTPPSERAELLLRRAGGYWFPGTEF